MKKSIIILAITALALQSCDNWLDLRPESETVLEDFWQTESQATSVLAGCYRGLIRNNSMERMMVWGELRSDNIVQGNSMGIDMQNIIDLNITPANPFADWGALYSVINYCNTFLKYAPTVVNKDQNFTETKLHTMESEALAVRSLCYFYLVRAFRDVPLVTIPSISDDDFFDVPKSTEQEILNQIISDLNIARTYAKPNFGSEKFDKGRFTLTAINALLADVYLWDQQYQNAVEACDRVMTDPSLALVNADKVVNEVFFAGNSTESIFELQFDRDFQYNDLVRDLYGIDKIGNWAYAYYLGPLGQFSPFNYLPGSLKESVRDLRNYNSISTTMNGEGYRILKYALVENKENIDESWSPVYRTSSTTPNWIVYRLSDIILMKAEALTQLNRNEQDLKEALKLVNSTYLRSNITADSLQYVNYSDKLDMEELILRERQRELMFEGKRWFDLMRVVKRTNNPMSILKYVSPKLTGDNLQIKKMSVMDALYMPVAKHQLEINPNLVQNPFYEEMNLNE